MPEIEVQPARSSLSTEPTAVFVETVPNTTVLTGVLSLRPFGARGIVQVSEVAFQPQQSVTIEVKPFSAEIDTTPVATTVDEAPLIMVNGDLGLPRFGVAGSVVVPAGVRARMGFAALGVMSEASVPTGVKGELSLPRFGIKSEVLNPPLEVRAALSLPGFGIAAQGSVPAAMRGSLGLPRLGIHALADQNRLVNATLGLPAFGMKVSAVQNVPVSVTASLGMPSFGMKGQMRESDTGQGGGQASIRIDVEIDLSSAIRISNNAISIG